MIQVLQRAAVVIEHLSRHGEAPLAELREVTGLKYITIYNIINTMVSLGWVARDGTLCRLGPVFTGIAHDESRKVGVAAIAEHYARPLAGRIEEGVAVAHFYKGELFTAVKVTVDREVMVSSSYFDTNSIYGTASGRLLLAYADEAERKAIIGTKGSWRKEWPEPRSADELHTALDAIRDAGIAFRGAQDDAVHAMAVPIRGSDGSVIASLGCFAPAFRLTAARKTAIVQELRKTAGAMSQSLGFTDAPAGNNSPNRERN